MIQRIRPILFTAGIMLLGLILTGCGGGNDAPDAVTAPDLGLVSLEIEGYDIDFDRLKAGPYSVTVAADVNEIQLTAVGASDHTKLAYTNKSVLGQAGSVTAEDLTSGVPVTVKIGAGDNIITVYVFSDDALLRSEYHLQVHRVSTTASLLHARFINVATSSNLTLNPAFESNHLTYTADVGYTACAFEGLFFSNERNTTIAVNGERIPHARQLPFPLQVGENLFETVVTAEDGQTTETYNFAITRAAATEALLEGNATLAGLTLSAGDLRFICAITEYNVLLNRNTTAVDIIAFTAADEATMTINDQTVVSGEPFNLVLEDGVNEVEIDVTAPNGETTLTYKLNLQRANTNIVNVDTVEELQTALLNAEPGDEIRVAAGRYEGVASVATSGSDSAHFYSDRSGTADDLIRIVGMPSSGPVVLAGTDTSTNAVLQLTGDYWRIAGLQFSDARNGILLSNASNNYLTGVAVTRTGEQGIIVRNGSSNNVINNALISETGIDISADRIGRAEGILIGSDDSEWASAPDGTGSYDEQDHDNVIRNSEFLSSIASEAIQVNEGTLRTIIENNIFTSGSLTGTAGDTSLISIQGNDVIVRYNTFYYREDENLAEVISVNDDSSAWNTDTSWGENAKIYQNLFVLKDREIPLVRSQDVASVLVGDNTRDDSVAPGYEGAGISQNFSTPVYQIRPAADDSACFDIETANGWQQVFLKECTSADSQLWQLVMDRDKFIRIQNVQYKQVEFNGELQDFYVTPRLQFIFYCPGANDPPALRLEPGFNGYIQRWGTIFDGASTFITNKYENSYGMTVPEQFQAGAAITACSSAVTSQERQALRLVEL